MPQTTTLMIAELGGLTATIEKHSPLVRRRATKPTPIYPGDGTSQPRHVQNPSWEFEPVTLELHPGKSQVFLAAAEAMFKQQMLDPTLAKTVILSTCNDGGEAVDTRTGVRAVIQEIHSPEGDTNQHALAPTRIVVDIIGIVGGSGNLSGFGPSNGSGTTVPQVAILRSLDTGISFQFPIAPQEHDREVSAVWENADVANAAPDFLEYRKTEPEKRTYRYTIDGYDNSGGLANDTQVEGQWKSLKYFTQLAANKHRAHLCLFSVGIQGFACVVEMITWPVKKVGSSAGALQVFEGTIVLKESRDAASIFSTIGAAAGLAF
ncbi:MAG TPA: hypothetical protein VI756_09125 [Blastocatellia bacterium]